MPRVPLDGLALDVPHALAGDEAARRLETVARELAHEWSAWGVQIERELDGTIRIAGEKGSARFSAMLASVPGQVRVSVEGEIDLTLVELALAGREAGVRGRVRREIERAVRKSLELA